MNIIPDTAIVTSGETSDENFSDYEPNGSVTMPGPTNKEDEDEEEEEEQSDEELRFLKNDEFYDENADEEDEAYVYRHLRSGVKESVRIQSLPNQQQQQQQQQIQDLKVYKPRNSDAILSCPCCFTIVCMDCQRHERYLNQFRAMFVMNIVVQWDHRLVYNEQRNMLVDYNNEESQKEMMTTTTTTKELYYTVCCAHCTTTVAALNMDDEVYHFYGCVATS